MTTFRLRRTVAAPGRREALRGWTVWCLIGMGVLLTPGGGVSFGQAAQSAAPEEATRGTSVAGASALVLRGDSLTAERVATLVLQRAATVRRQQFQVRAQHGLVEVAGEPFRPTASLQFVAEQTASPSGAEAGSGVGEPITQQSSYRVDVSKKFRSGVHVTPSVEAARTHVSASGAQASTLGSVNLGIVVPLMQGRGATVNAGEERAAWRELEAERETLRDRAAQSVRDGIEAYWSLWGAQQRLAIAEASEARGRDLLAKTEALVAAHQRPAADLEALKANFADLTAARLDAQQGLDAARHALGRLLFLSPAQVAALPPVVQSAPDGGSLSEVPPDAVDTFVAHALTRRADVRSDRLRADAARQRLDVARDGLDPRVDLSVNVGYSGLDRGDAINQYLTPLARNVDGVNATVSLRFSQPFTRRSVRGRIARQEAQLSQIRLDEEANAQAIERQIELAVLDLNRRRQQLQQMDAAVSHYRQAFENEQKRFNLGVTTLFDVLNVQDRLTAARLRQVETLQQYGAALIRLRYEVDRIVEETSGQLRVVSGALDTVPSF